MSCGCPGGESASYEFDPASFRAAFPEFADPVAWPDAQLVRNNEMALCYISPRPGKRLKGACRALAIDLMTAHLLKLDQALASGDMSGLVNSATVDKVSVSLTPPPLKSQRDWWYALTGRGQQLLALLKSKAAGGLYVGGLPPERAAFRRAGGVFGGGKGSS
ncbi:DUF4054 domain-containing protein [Desulfovibrio sp. OttesenSCG-928-C14]|nr:DUF4054 domain-containing protein [Desulfovibrio sp. OttesenSCG-928-C14]